MNRNVPSPRRPVVLLRRSLMPVFAASALAAVALPVLAQSADAVSAKRTTMTTQGSQAAKGGKADSAAVARGKYIVNTAGCHDCHTPWKMGSKGPEPDMTRMLSGHPQDFAVTPLPKLEGPWGSAGSVTN